jgi:uncharacterized protein (TIGR02099 family)
MSLPSETPPPAAPLVGAAIASRRPPRWRRWFKGVLVLGMVLLLVAATAWGVLLTQILPRMDSWRDALSQQATRALGLSVKINGVQGWRDGIWPVLSLRDVQVFDAQGRPGLRLAEVRARLSISTLSPRALADGELRLGELALVGPELDVRRDRHGRISVAGFELPEQPSGGDDADKGLDWVLSQAHIRIEHGTVRWSDDWLGAPPLTLTELDFRLDNRAGLGRRTHQITLAATPPAAFGRRFELGTTQTQPLWQVGERVQAVGQDWPWWQRWAVQATRPSQWSTWSGPAKVSLPWVDVQRLRQHVRLPVDVLGGQGGLQLQLQLAQGRVESLSLEGSVQHVALRLAPDLPMLAFKRLEGSVSVGHQAEQSSLVYQNLGFELDEGLVWPRSSGSLVWRHAPLADPLVDQVWRLTRGGEARADRLDLALLARIADRLPLAPTIRQKLAELSPQGVLTQARWQWDGPVEAPGHYRAAGEVEGLALAPSDAAGGRPGLSGVTASFEATEAGGQAQVQLKSGWVAFPGVFDTPQLPVDKLQARLTWHVQAPSRAGQLPQWQVEVAQVSVANADASGQLEGHWQTAGWDGQGRVDLPRLPGTLKLSGRFDRADATAVWRYLPNTIPAAARAYVRDAILAGRGEKMVFDVDGDLNEFPFPHDKGGRFRVKVPVRQLRLDYVPPRLLSDHGETPSSVWPPFTDLDGTLLFEGQRLIIRDASGLLGSVGSGSFRMRHVEGLIDDLGARDPHLSIKGQGEGPLDDMFRFLSASPIGPRTGQVLQSAQAAGQGAMTLSLDIPLDHASDTRVQGEVLLTDEGRASLRLQPGLPALARMQGRIGFTESELKVKARAVVWGSWMEVSGHRSPDGQTRFDAVGTVTAASLREAREFTILPVIAQKLTGEAPVAVSVTLLPDVHGHAPAGPTVQVTSNLQGMAANWPAPLNKAAGMNWPLKVVYRPEDNLPIRDAISVELGQASANAPQLQVELRRDTSGPSARLQRGSIQLWQGGMAAPSALTLPASGMSAQVQLPLVDVDAWLPVVRQLQADARNGPSDGGEGIEPYLPRSIAIKTALLQFKQRSLKDVAGTLSHPAPDVWRAQVDAVQASGMVEWSPDASGAGHKLVARLQRLSIPQAEVQALEDQAAEQLTGGAATRLPEVDLVVDQFDWRGLSLGKLEVQASNRAVAGEAVPEWRLQRFRLGNPQAQLQAQGNWALPIAAVGRASAHASALSRSSFQFTLDLVDSGALLTRLGLPKTIRGGKGQMTGQVSWQGSPLEPDPLSMTGDIKVRISEGQFLKVDPGIAKLLGVLSLQSLPRRLTLDFRDVFEKGFAFDAIDGDVTIGEGAARTRNMRMRGVVALVLMEGEADLARETQNIHVYVVPEVNAVGASLAYAAINPVVGLGTFLAQVLLRKQVSEAGTQEFRVTGPWSDPNVERVDNKEAGKAAAAVANAASDPAPLPKPAAGASSAASAPSSAPAR